MSNDVKRKLNKAKVKSVLPTKQQNRIKNRSRTTPWHNTAEFDYVGRCLSHALSLFPSQLADDDNSEKSESGGEEANIEILVTTCLPLNDEAYNELLYAIHRVSLWRQRAENSRLPHSLDVSASLAVILLQDAHRHHHHHQQQENNSFSFTSSSAISLRLSYASIIIRAVNGIADSMQRNRAVNGSSVSHLCSQVGLPLWIVDLRHDASHNELPSLISLRLAAKSLIGFLMEKYWAVLENQRLAWVDDGVTLLMECKRALKAAARSNNARGADQMVQEDVVDEEQLSDNDDDEEEDDEQNNIYSIFIVKDKKDSADNKKKQHTTSTKSNQAKNNKDGRTPRRCINEFIKTIPIDAGMNILISYLVYGGIGDAPDQRGILIPGSPTTFPQTMESVRKIRERYSLIIIAFAAKWPGFLHTLLINIVDFVLSLESTTHENDNNTHEEDSNAAKLRSEEAGRTRKLYFLMHWARFLLSNECYYFLGWIDMTFKGSRNMRQRPRDRWSDELMDVMESPAPVEVLKSAQLPLNSLCDRCILEGNGDTSREIVSLLRDALGSVRAKGVILKHGDDLGSGAGTKRPGVGATARPKRPRTPSNENDLNDDGVKKGRVEEIKVLSLEEMEGLISNDDESMNEAKMKMKTKVKDDTGTSTGKCSIEEYDQRQGVRESSKITPWTLCTTWDACAIGTLPGYA